MLTLHHIPEVRTQVAQWRQAGERMAFVPTMGNLHAGHIHLVAIAQTMATRTVASIFVNPSQFGPTEDFAAYPRTLAADQAQLAAAGLDLLFTPSPAEMYPRPMETMTRVWVPALSELLCGEQRPTHFAGVAQVVAKLFQQVQPDIALFGEKDWQQLTIIRRMVADLDMPITIVGVPTVREPDGLAMSSRNGYLTPAERQQAPTLYATLLDCAAQWRAGTQDREQCEAEAVEKLRVAGFQPDYVAIRRADDLQLPTDADTDSTVRILAAARLGTARLIDNIPCTQPFAPCP